MKEFKSRILRSLKSLPSPSPNFAIPASASPKSFLLHPFQLIKQFHNDYDDDDNNKENSLRADDQMILSDPQPPDGEDAEDASTTKQAPSFRRPNPHSPTLFDPALLAAFRQAVADYERNRPTAESAECCPPVGKQFVTLYTTSLRGIRKTFEDCNAVRMLLENLKVVFHERDVSMDLGYKEEMWRLLESSNVPTPRLFIGGRYVGGADEVVGLHEQGKLLPLLRRAPRRRGAAACEGCGAMRFVVCAECDGSRKLYDEERSAAVRCPNCNENGLVPCPLCS